MPSIKYTLPFKIRVGTKLEKKRNFLHQSGKSFPFSLVKKRGKSRVIHFFGRNYSIIATYYKEM
jgi:hypothetical protein